MDNYVRIGQVGCNGVAFEHARGAQLAGNAQLVAACDVNRRRLGTFQERFGVDITCDYRELVERDDIDLVSIVTPDETHAEIAIVAAQAGKHVLIEKPLATSLAEARAIQKAVERAGVKAMCAQSQRFIPKFQKAKEVLDSGRIGKPVFVRISAPSSPFWTEPAWAGSSGSRGAAWLLLHNGMHNIDYLSWFCDSLPERIYAVSHPGQAAKEGWLNTHEYVSASIRFENGMIAQSEENRIMQPGGYPFHCELYIVGTKGTMDLSDRVTHPMTFWSCDGLQFPGAHVNHSNADHPFAGEIRHMCDCILRDTEPMIPLSFSIRILEVLLAGQKSLESGAVVHIDNEVDHV